MKLTRTNDGYIVEVPDDVVTALALREGDEVDLHRIAAPAPLSAAEEETILLGIRKLSRPLPQGYRFDRDEANAR